MLVNGLTDRNSAIRKHNATAIGHLVATAKDSSLEKLMVKLQNWYFEREGKNFYTLTGLRVKNYTYIKVP